MASKAIAADTLQRLRQFSTCDIGDALVKLKIPHGGFLSGLHMFSPAGHATSPSRKMICGPAHIVRMVHASDTSSPRPQKHFADTITRDSVVFVSQPKGLISACWGGLMSARASKLGAAGVVIDGRFRDLSEHREVGMPLFARAQSILGSNTFTRAAEINVPVRYRVGDGVEGEDGGLSDVDVHPGDIIMGDEDGVVAIPPGVVDQCLELCRQRRHVDKETLARLQDGKEMGSTIKELRR